MKKYTLIMMLLLMFCSEKSSDAILWKAPNKEINILLTNTNNDRRWKIVDESTAVDLIKSMEFYNTVGNIDNASRNILIYFKDGSSNSAIIGDDSKEIYIKDNDGMKSNYYIIPIKLKKVLSKISLNSHYVNIKEIGLPEGIDLNKLNSKIGKCKAVIIKNKITSVEDKKYKLLYDGTIDDVYNIIHSELNY